MHKLRLQPNVSDIGHPELVDAAQRHLPGKVTINFVVVCGGGRRHKLSLPHTQDGVFAPPASPPFCIPFPAVPPQRCRDPRPAIAGPLKCDPLNGVTQIHIAIGLGRCLLVKAVETGAAHPSQFHHMGYWKSFRGFHFFLDLPVDRGLPVSACSIRCSSMRCKHPFKKSISSACWPTLRSNSAIRPSDQRCFPLPGKALPGPWRNSRRQRCNTFALTSKARAASPIGTPLFQSPHRGQLELFCELSA